MRLQHTFGQHIFFIVHLAKFTWNLTMEPDNWVMFRFHGWFQGCIDIPGRFDGCLVQKHYLTRMVEVTTDVFAMFQKIWSVGPGLGWFVLPIRPSHEFKANYASAKMYGLKQRHPDMLNTDVRHPPGPHDLDWITWKFTPDHLKNVFLLCFP